MSKIFRKIRLKFLKQNKSIQYLKYAVGEIALVVIGILIALYINNLNELRKNDKKEKAIVKEIHKDFSKNLQDFLSIKAFYKANLQAAIQFKKYINHPNPLSVKDSIGEYYNLTFSNGFTYNPSNGVVESLINSGDYQLIKNDTMRRLLVSWKDVLNDYVEEETPANTYFSKNILPFIIENGDYTNMNNEINFKGISSSRKFKNLVERYIHNVSVLLFTIENEPIENHLREIVRLSNTENYSPE